MGAHGINPGPLGMLALTAVDANNRGIGMRNVVAMAANLPGETKAALSHLSKEAVVRAEALEEMAGITPPFGFFDPCKLSVDIDGTPLAYYREAELKHGRLAMLGSLGIIAGEAFSPLFGATERIPAVQQFGKAQPAVPAQFWGAVFVAASFVELFMLNKQQMSTERDYNNPLQAGDFDWDPLGLRPKDPANFKSMQNKEILNGRLAMIAVTGMIAQELVQGKQMFSLFK